MIVVIGRFVNMAVPWALAQVIRVFEEGSQSSAWPYLFAYVGLRFLQATGGLPALREVRIRKATITPFLTYLCAYIGSLGSCYAILGPRYVV